MGSRTPKHPEDTIFDTQPPPSSEHSISDRLSQLAAAAWATEQDLPLDHARLTRIQRALRTIEECLDESGEPSAEASENEDDVRKLQISEDNEEPRDSVNPNTGREELNEIQRSLRATLQSMRLRQQEQRHLNQLSLEKLESVAQTSLVREHQVKVMAEDVQNLRIENRKIGEENDGLREQIADLESQATQKEVAVNAMSSAVAGLEGWINSSPGPALYGDSATPTRQKRGKYVVRGKGRFRGRYYIDEPETESLGVGPDGGSSSKELHDGVNAWLRGFRDVQEELQKASPGKQRRLGGAGAEIASAEDDWGDFETVSETQ
jgi:hypothetical protein